MFACVMMAANYTAASCSRLHRSRSATTTSAISSAFPGSVPLRRNSLRQKILKTLRHPSIPIDSHPLQHVIEPVLKEIQESHESENPESGDQQIQEIEVVKEAGISVPTIEIAVDGGVGLFDKNLILKYGLCLAGAFIFQAVFAVWVFGSADSGNRNGNLDGHRKDPVLGVREKGKLNQGTGNGALCVNEVGMEREIEQIRAMARKAREKERLESKNDGLDSKDDNDVDAGNIDRTGIDLEVDNQLIKLRKKLEHEPDRIPVTLIRHSRKEGARKDGAREGELIKIEGNVALLFKKKYKFKDLSIHQGEKPKGFQGSDDHSIQKPKRRGKMEEGVELLRSGNGGDDAVNLGVKKSI